MKFARKQCAQHGRNEKHASFGQALLHHATLNSQHILGLWSSRARFSSLSFHQNVDIDIGNLANPVTRVKWTKKHLSTFGKLRGYRTEADMKDGLDLHWNAWYH